MPKAIYTDDDIRYIAEALKVERRDIELLLFALKEARRQSGARNDFKLIAKQVLKRLYEHDSILSVTGKRMAKIIYKCNHYNQSIKAINEFLSGVRQDEDTQGNQTINTSEIDWYIHKLQTPKRFNEWIESISRRTTPHSVQLIYKFIHDPEISITFVDIKTRKRFVLYTPFVLDKVSRMHVLMETVFKEVLLLNIVNGHFKVFRII